MKNKFEIGQRVAAYNQYGRMVSAIKEITETGYIILNGGHGPYHPKQLFRIKKKEPKYYWVLEHKLHSTKENAEAFADGAVKVKIVKE